MFEMVSFYSNKAQSKHLVMIFSISKLLNVLPKFSYTQATKLSVASFNIW